jgi:hypothetical protein
VAELFSRKSLLLALALLLSSWAVVQAGVFFGREQIPMGAGQPEAYRITSHDLFRFDSLYYLAIAEHGYAYNGDPNSSPNIVFAPAFPLLVRALSTIMPGDTPLAGLILNKILFFFGLVFMLDFLRAIAGEQRAFWTLFAMVTAAGAYAFHAFYSESSMLFFLSLALVSPSARRLPLDRGTDRRWIRGFIFARGLAEPQIAREYAPRFAVCFAQHHRRGRLFDLYSLLFRQSVHAPSGNSSGFVGAVSSAAGSAETIDARLLRHVLAGGFWAGASPGGYRHLEFNLDDSRLRRHRLLNQIMAARNLGICVYDLFSFYLFHQHEFRVVNQRPSFFCVDGAAVSYVHRPA